MLGRGIPEREVLLLRESLDASPWAKDIRRAWRMVGELILSFSFSSRAKYLSESKEPVTRLKVFRAVDHP